MTDYPIKTAVFPVAGLGTRFLPATKASPKEMLSIVDKPLIQYAVEEAIAAGVNELIFVTSSSKRAIEDHFDSNYELESKLEQRGDYEMLSMVRSILPPHVTCCYVRQAQPLGLGHAVYCAKRIVGDNPFAVILADDLIERDTESCLSRMVELYRETNSSIIAVEPVEPDQTERYGIVAFEKPDEALPRITQIVEKPKPQDAPTNFAAVGRYILTPEIFNQLKQIDYGAHNELQLTDAIAGLLKHESVYAHRIVGKRYDCGSKLGFLQATTEYALKHPDIGQDYAEYLQQLITKPINVKNS